MVHFLPKHLQRVHVLIRGKRHVPTNPAVPTTWTTVRYKLFSPKRNHPVPAVPGFHVNLRRIEIPHLRRHSFPSFQFFHFLLLVIVIVFEFRA